MGTGVNSGRLGVPPRSEVSECLPHATLSSFPEHGGGLPSCGTCHDRPRGATAQFLRIHPSPGPCLCGVASRSPARTPCAEKGQLLSLWPGPDPLGRDGSWVPDGRHRLAGLTQRARGGELSPPGCLGSTFRLPEHPCPATLCTSGCRGCVPATWW